MPVLVVFIARAHVSVGIVRVCSDVTVCVCPTVIVCVFM